MSTIQRLTLAWVVSVGLSGTAWAGFDLASQAGAVVGTGAGGLKVTLSADRGWITVAVDGQGEAYQVTSTNTDDDTFMTYTCAAGVLSLDDEDDGDTFLYAGDSQSSAHRLRCVVVEEDSLRTPDRAPAPTPGRTSRAGYGLASQRGAIVGTGVGGLIVTLSADRRLITVAVDGDGYTYHVTTDNTDDDTFVSYTCKAGVLTLDDQGIGNNFLYAGDGEADAYRLDCHVVVADSARPLPERVPAQAPAPTSQAMPSPALPAFPAPGDARVSEAGVSRFLAGWAQSVGTARDATTGYPRRIRRLRDDGEMVLIPAGTFQMGAIPSDASAVGDELPRHTVTLSRAYYLDVNEVTIGQWKKFVSSGGARLPSGLWSGATDRHPIHDVDHTAATAFATWAGASLPTEAQWERAAKGGRDDFVFPWGPSGDVKKSNGGGGEDGFDGLAPVRSYAPNDYGLYDMSGNVWEWCADWYGRKYYAESPGRDPSGPGSGAGRVARGGSWFDLPVKLRASFRGAKDPTGHGGLLGFRLARSL